MSATHEAEPEFEDDEPEGVEPVADDEATPLDASAEADFYAAVETMSADEIDEPADVEFSTDSLQLFLKDIGKVDLLTAVQEVELAKKIERGDHRAKQAMVEANLRLVVSIAKRYQVVERLNKIMRAERKLRAERGREPTNVEIAEDLDMTVEEVESIRRTSQAPVSLEKPVGDEEESEFGHFIEDENVPLPDEAADTAFRAAALSKCLSALSYRERRVLELRYGLNGEQPSTLDEVGRLFQVTRERIRQIENQGLKKLRALADSQKLRDVA